MTTCFQVSGGPGVVPSQCSFRWSPKAYFFVQQGCFEETGGKRGGCMNQHGRLKQVSV